MSDDWRMRLERRAAVKTTISVKLTEAELARLEALRRKRGCYYGEHFQRGGGKYGSDDEPRGDVLRRLVLAAAPETGSDRPRLKRKTTDAGAKRKTKLSSTAPGLRNANFTGRG